MSRRLLLALIRRDGRLLRAAPLPLLLEALGLLAGLALFYYIGRYFADGRPGFFAFAVAGMAVLRMHGGLLQASQRFEADHALGLNAILFSSPAPAWVVALGSCAFELQRATVTAVMLLASAFVVFGATFSANAGSLAAAAVAVLGAAALFGTLAMLTLAAFLRFRLGTAVAGLAGIALPILAGAYFPLSVLPQPLQGLGQLLPLRLAVDAVRDGVLAARADVGEAGLLWVWVGVLFPLAALAVQAGLAHARRVGTLHQS